MSPKHYLCFFFLLPLWMLLLGCGDTREKAEEVMDRTPEAIEHDIEAAKEAMGREIDPEEIVDRGAKTIDQIKDRYYELRYELKESYRETFEEPEKSPVPGN